MSLWSSAWQRSPKHVDGLGDPLPAGAVGRLGTTRLQHIVDQGNEHVDSLAFHPTANVLAAGGNDGRISVWDSNTGRLLTMLARHRGEVQALAFSPDGRLLLSGDRDGYLYLWDSATWRQIHEVKAATVSISALAFSPSANAWAVASFSEPVTLWETRPPYRQISELPGARDRGDFEEDRFHALAFSADGGRLAAASSYQFRGEELPPDKLGKFMMDCPDPFEAMNHPEYFISKIQDQAQEMMKTVREEFGDDRLSHGITFGDEGGVQKGWRVGHAGRLTVWKLPSGQREAVWEMEEGPAHTLGFSADGTILLAAGRGVQLWDVRQRRRLPPDRAPSAWLGSAGCSPAGITVVMREKTPCLWDVGRNRALAPLASSFSGTPHAFNSQGDRVAVLHWRTTIEINDAKSGREVLSLPRHADQIGGLAFSRDARHAATAGGATVMVWDMHQQAESARLTEFGPPLAISPSGARLAGLRSRDGETHLVVYDWHRRQQIADLEGVEPTAFLFLDDDELLVGNELGQIGRYSLAAGKWVKILRGPEGAIRGLALSSCGQRIASGSGDGCLHIRKTSDGSRLREISVPAAGQEMLTQELAFSADGKHLGWGTQRGVFLLFDEDKSTPVQRFEAPHRLEAAAISFSLRGRLLAAGATPIDDNAEGYGVSVWDVSTGQKLLATPLHEQPVCPLAFTPDRRLLASGSWDRTVLLWDVSSL